MQPEVTFHLNANKPAQEEKRFNSSQTQDRRADCREGGRVCLLLEAVLARVKPNWTQIIWSTIQRGGRVGGWEGRADKTNPKKLLAAE